MDTFLSFPLPILVCLFVCLLSEAAQESNELTNKKERERKRKKKKEKERKKWKNMISRSKGKK